MVSLSIINIGLIDIGVIVWFYHWWKSKKLEERIKILEKKKTKG